MKRILVVLLAAVLCLMLTGPVRAEVGVTDDTILLGSFQDMSGPGAYLGKMCTTALNVWMDWVNAEGGIHGRKLKLVVEDNKYDPVLTKTAFNKLVNQHKVFSIVLVYGSTPCTAVKEDIAKEKIPVFPTMATVQSMFDPPNRYLFWYACSDEDNGVMMVDYILNDLKKDKKDVTLGVLYQDDEWGKSALTGVTVAAKQQGMKVVSAGYKRGQKNLSSQVMKLKSKGVNYCFYAGYAPVYAAALQQADKVGWKPIFFGDYVTVDPRTFMAGKLAHGHYHFFNLGMRHEQTPGWQQVEKLFTAAGEEQAKLLNVPLMPLLWNPLLMLTQAMKDAGPDLTREKVIDAIEAMKEFETGGNGKIEYGPNLRKGTHKYRVMQCDAEKKQFVPVTDWREPSIKWEERKKLY